MKTTNYYNTLIEVAEDCPVNSAEIPPVKGDKKTIANLEFDMIINNPYKYTSDDVLFKVYALRNEISKPKLESEREAFFEKPHACMRASPLPKRYGWGVHSDDKGKVAIYPIESAEYRTLQKDNAVTHVKAMRSKRA